MAPKKSSSAQGPSSEPLWVRCPRAPCIVSYHPQSARQHLVTCRYFRCCNISCRFRGTQREVCDHESDCPYGLRSEEIGTTDPLSDTESEVLDILTSPSHRPSYPTDPSSDYVPESSPQKHFFSGRRTFPHDQLSVSPSTLAAAGLHDKCSSSNPPPLVAPSRLARVPVKRSSLGCTAGTSSRCRVADQLLTLDPYDPSAKRIFSLPAEAIDPTLRPVSVPASQRSSPVPSPPVRRLATYELQRFSQKPPSRPVSVGGQSSGPVSIDRLQARLAHKSAQLEVLMECYISVLGKMDDLSYSVYQRPEYASLFSQVSAFPMYAYRKVVDQLAMDAIPDPVRGSDALSQDGEEEENDEDEQTEDEDEDAEGELRDVDVDWKESVDIDILSTDQLSEAVRLKISENEHRSSHLMDSPGNVYGRKRKRDQCDPTWPGSSQSPAAEVDRPTLFIQKLADTTWDPSDELESNRLPSRCNLNKVLEKARMKMELRVRRRNEELSGDR